VSCVVKQDGRARTCLYVNIIRPPTSRSPTLTFLPIRKEHKEPYSYLAGFPPSRPGIHHYHLGFSYHPAYVIMASPAAVSSSGVVDPHRKAHYTVQLSDNLVDGTTDDPAYSAVRFNHKPTQSGGSRTTKLRSSGGNAALLDIKDREDGETSIHHYEGTKSFPKKSYVLVFDPNTQTATLQPLTSSYSLNLKSPKQLAEQYTQIHEQSDTSDNGEGSEPLGSMSDDEPDPNNPFDFRHFLDGAKPPRLSASPVQAPAQIPKVASLADSSASRERSVSNPEGKSSQRSTQQKPTPRIRVERKASTRGDEQLNALPKKSSKLLGQPKRDSDTLKPRVPVTSIPRSQETPKSQEFDLLEDDDEDDFMGSSGAGGLEIDFGDEPPPRSRARALTLPGSSRGGPISLRSAANSPSSQINTPRRRIQDVDDFEIDMGSGGMGHEEDEEDADVSDEDEQSPPLAARNSRVAREVLESDGDDDVDVEPMSLGSPAHQLADGSSDEMDLAGGVWAGLAESGHISQAQESESESEAE
jgi:hypothetical protein